MVKLKILLFLLFGCSQFASLAQSNFVSTKGHQFFISNEPYYYVGANYWYGGIVSNTEKGKIRIKKELDFLSSKGISNLRIVAGVEGEGKINGVNRISPAYQPEQGVFNDKTLQGLDFLLTEMKKRKMKAVLFLSNNWDWSGGFLQYLNWNGLLADSIMRRKLSWDENRDYVSKFYTCKPCTDAYDIQLKRIINRVNSVSGIAYKNDPAIMAWELANEPRPMRPSAIEAYVKWNYQVAALIKSIDKNHLVTTGCEGETGMENLSVFEKVHSSPNIDYLTIHIWPKNWGWFKDTSISKDFTTINSNTVSYINKHLIVANRLNKPLVLEEFGLPRNLHVYNVGSSVSLRDQYFTNILRVWNKSRSSGNALVGCNFWAFGGIGRPSEKALLWQKGDDYIGDPPPEEQGLNSVFDTDLSTWRVIQSFTKKMK